MAETKRHKINYPVKVLESKKDELVSEFNRLQESYPYNGAERTAKHVRENFNKGLNRDKDLILHRIKQLNQSINYLKEIANV